MNKTVVVYHSGYGHTQRVAQHVAEGAGGEALAIDAEGNLPDGGWEKLAAADAIIFGTPTYMGGPSWQFKKFADASSKAWYPRAWQDKVFGGFTNSASPVGDKGATMIQLQTLASQSNLTIRHFRPRAIALKELHAEWPIELEVEGSYHNVGQFLDKVSKLPRIINVGAMELTTVSPARPGVTVKVTCTAMTFVLNDQPAPAAAAKPGAPAAPAGGDMMSTLSGMLPLVLMFVVLYFVMIRPQMKRQKEHRAMVEAIAKGDEVVIGGGMLGRVTRLSEQYLHIEIANGVEVQVQRAALVQVLPKGTLK